MPHLIFYRDDTDRCYVAEYLSQCSQDVAREFDAKTALLAREGYLLRRPHAAPLGDGIHELRVTSGRVHHRFLFFFWGGTAVLLTHGFQKEGAVPREELNRARRLRERFVADPAGHCFSP